MIMRRFKIQIKAISICVICFFASETVIFAEIPTISRNEYSTIAVQSIFNPILDEGITVTAEFQSEIFLGLRSLMTNPSCMVANTFINEMYADKAKMSFIEFTDVVQIERNLVKARFKVRGKENMFFEVKYIPADSLPLKVISHDQLRQLFEIASSPMMIYENVFSSGDLLEISRVTGILTEEIVHFSGPIYDGAIAKGYPMEQLNRIEDMSSLVVLLPREELSENYKEIIELAKNVLNGKKDKILAEIDKISPSSNHNRKKAHGRKARQKAKSREKNKMDIEKEALETSKDEARSILEELLRPDNDNLFYIFKALVDGLEDYIMGFNKSIDGEYVIGLSSEILDNLRHSPELLAEYLFHEALCGVILSHSELIKLQGRIFGNGNDLKDIIRKTIIEKTFKKIAANETNSDIKWLPGGRAFMSTPEADTPVRVEISEEAIASGLTAEIIAKILGLVSSATRDLTGINEVGRSLVIPLSGNNMFSRNGRKFTAVKIKQVTYRGGPPILEPYDDSDEQIRQSLRSMTIDERGAMRVGDTPLHPKGGGYISESLNEYRTMVEAFKAGIETAFPMGVGEFISMDFEGKKLGFVIMAIEDDMDKRVGSEIKKRIQAAYERGISSSRYERLAALDDVKRAYIELNEKIAKSAKTLRSFHEKGLIHTQPHLSNFGYTDKTTGKIYDFTKVKSFKGMTKEQFIYYVFNDFRSFYTTTLALSVFEELTSDNVIKYLALTKGLDIPVFVEPIFRGYFTSEDMDGIEKSRIIEAISLINMWSSVITKWDESTVDGKTLEEVIGSDASLVILFRELAGNMYDRLNLELEITEEKKDKDEWFLEKDLLKEAKEKLTGYRINMHVDLSVIAMSGDTLESGRDEIVLEEIMKALAIEIARHRAMGLDVRYTFNGGTNTEYKIKAIDMLKSSISNIADRLGILPEELLNKIENLHIAKPADDVPIITVKLGSVDGIRELKRGRDALDKFTYAVVLDKASDDDYVSIPNYTAAADIGLALAALGIAIEEEKNGSITRQEYEKTRKKVTNGIMRILDSYEINTSELSEEILETIIAARNILTRLEFALAFSIPPIVKWTTELLKKSNDARELLLTYA